MENRKHRQEISFRNHGMDSEKADHASIYCLAWNYLSEKEKSLIWKPN
jgi:TorA maturation chaperone TorD